MGTFGESVQQIGCLSHCCGKLYYTQLVDIFVSILENLWTVFAMNYIHLTSKGKMTLSGLLVYSKVNKTSEQNVRMGKEWSGKQYNAFVK